ncbi:alpha/beta hydrolase [Amycolatopsis nigrescens]|uniref:alpha/beta hydrolase n=1 Tax=Amycolatopsis nigrescens TaxID=381445 RepID=UPI00036F616D|nr:alpha/beta hydrolase-fold protein [Amycolatopsis nigrescens]
MVSRRGLLLGGAAVALSAGGCAREPEPERQPGPPAGPPPPARVRLTEPVTVERVHSAARGADLDLVLVAPEGVPTAGLPVCVALHGRGSNARMFLELGLPAALTEAVRAGMPPFAVAAVDGAHYWVTDSAGDDPQRMLNTELPGWLARRDLRPDPVAAFGISMGGFGALRYARDHDGLRAVAVCSPALFVSWNDAKARKVFIDRPHWERDEPLLHIDELKPVPVGVWCGTFDPFIKATRKFVQTAHPAETGLSPGAHNEKYWKRVLPDIVRFVGGEIATLP